ncbi:hypothetical protein PIROE2DRAFT_4006, partial [Piromyces sp. E2]
KHSEEEYYEENEEQSDSKTDEVDIEGNVLMSYVNDYDNSEEENNDSEPFNGKKKIRIDYYSDENEKNIKESENSENEFEISDSEIGEGNNFDCTDLKHEKGQKTYSDDSQSDLDNDDYQSQDPKEKFNNNKETKVELELGKSEVEEPESSLPGKMKSNKLSYETASTPSKFRPFFFSSRTHTNDNSVSGRHTLSKSSSSSSGSSGSIIGDSTDLNQGKSLFGFNFSRKNSKVEGESNKKEEESELPRKNSATSKFTSFFHRTSSKPEKNHTAEVVSDTTNKTQTQQTTTVGTSTMHDMIDQDEVKRVPKRKRNSSDDENDSDIELERQKVKKIRLLEEEIKTIQESIKLKQEELQLQYDNLIKTRNSLSDPSKEPLPDFMHPSSMDFNLPPLYPSKINRPSTSSNFSRSSYYDYPFEIPSYPGEFDPQNTSYASNDYHRINHNQRMSSTSRMSMDDHGRYSFNPGPEDPSFFSNIDGSSSKFNINPNRASTISPTTNPRFSNSSFYSRYDPSNYQNSYISPTSPQPPKNGLFSFMRRRKTPTPDPPPMYAPSNSMMSSIPSFDQSQNPMTNISGSNYKKLPSMDVSLTKPFYYYFIPLTKRKVVVHVDPLLRNAINYARAAGNFDCLKYLCEFEKIPNKYVDLRSIEEAAAHNDIDELKFLLKHSWFYDLKRHFVRLFKILFLLAIVVLILYCFNGLNEILIALFVTYVSICVTYNWIHREK